MFNWSFDSISSKSLLNGVTDVLPRGPKLLSATIKKRINKYPENKPET